ncbi:hypothetical protein JK361_40180 [Streptomyces sp. 5-8]|uniref:Uncharacterized protein n=1 Tax=Streptomyces musisoli TaxID=2802280 RepID=A0ABS1PE73_9ACTN|nr:hypothetical protein [Streptomyces musisoli]MBL1110687.1 hypothetical protein [Streptomyces musisoli]
MQFAESLAICTEPLLESLCETLMEQLGDDPDIFSLPGDATGPVGFGETWMRTVRELSSSGRAVSGSEDDDPGERASVQPDDVVAPQPG